MRSRPLALLLLPLAAALLLATGCHADTSPLPRQGAAGPPPEEPRTLQLPLEAPCHVNVQGTGQVHIEDSYVANVVACENGNAPMEALKAQAIQARGYLYYVMLVNGQSTIGDSQSDQVFSCPYATAGPRHFEAARATRGQYLTWGDNIIAPFYVAGAIPANPNDGAPEEACDGAGGNDSTTTQRFVTYNLGLSGCTIEMTTLGWVPDDGDCNRNPRNRGCASQNGQSCLASRGWFYEDMQRFHYGEDIQIRQATGSCGGVSTEPPNYDAYCMRHDDPSHCVDQTQRVICDGDEATAVEDCSAGCLLGECLTPPEEPETDPCEELDCADGCEEGQCVVDDTVIPDDPHDPQDPQDPADPGTDGDPAGSSPPGALVTRSAGVTSGGCSTAPSYPSPLALLVALVGLALISFRRADPRRRPTRG